MVYFLSLLWDNSRPLSDVYLHNPENNQLDGSSGVPLLGHGAAERLHGLVVGASQQRLAVHRNQLVVDAQTSVLWITLDIITHVHFWCSRQQITTPEYTPRLQPALASPCRLDLAPGQVGASMD